MWCLNASENFIGLFTWKLIIKHYQEAYILPFYAKVIT